MRKIHRIFLHGAVLALSSGLGVSAFAQNSAAGQGVATAQSAAPTGGEAAPAAEAAPVVRYVYPQGVEGDAPSEGFGDIDARAPAPLGGVYNVPVDALVGKPVVNPAGLPIGEVEEAVVSPADSRAGVVISTGDRIGIGGSRVLAPAQELELVGESLVWNTSSSVEQIRYSSRFAPEEFETVDDDQFDTLAEAVNAAVAVQ